MEVTTATFLRRQLRFARTCAVRAGDRDKVEEIDWWRAQIDELASRVPTPADALVAAEPPQRYGTDDQVDDTEGE